MKNEITLTAVVDSHISAHTFFNFSLSTYWMSSLCVVSMFVWCFGQFQNGICTHTSLTHPRTCFPLFVSLAQTTLSALCRDRKWVQPTTKAARICILPPRPPLRRHTHSHYIKTITAIWQLRGLNATQIKVRLNLWGTNSDEGLMALLSARAWVVKFMQSLVRQRVLNLGPCLYPTTILST